MTSKNNPYVTLFDSIQKAMSYPVPLKVHNMNEDGDVFFSVPWGAFGWPNSPLIGRLFTAAVANMIGETLVRAHLQAFDPVIASKHYPEACKRFTHRGFGMRTIGQDLVVYLHCQYLVKIYNQYPSAANK